MTKFWLFFLSTSTILRVTTCELMTQVTIVTTRVWPCTLNATNEFNFVSTKLHKVNRDPFIDADIQTSVPFSDKIQLHVKCSYWVDGGFKPRLSMPFGGVCSGIRTVVPTWFKTMIQQTQAKGCPLPPGNYSLKNWPAKIDFTLPILTGRYRTTMLFTKNGVLIGCLHSESNAVPKKKN